MSYMHTASGGIIGGGSGRNSDGSSIFILFTMARVFLGAMDSVEFILQ